MSAIKEQKPSWKKIVEISAVTFVLVFGIFFIGTMAFLRLNEWLESLEIGEGSLQVIIYLEHLSYAVIMVLYALAVKPDRKYFIEPFKGDTRKHLFYGVIGLIAGFVMNAACVLPAVWSGTLTLEPAAVVNVPVIIAALFAVYIQSSVEEFGFRAFMFGKSRDEGVPVWIAVLVSSFAFMFLHSANDGFGFLPMIELFTSAVFLAVSYHVFGSIWFACSMHMAWNFTQDFIFGLPNSGMPSACSIFVSAQNTENLFFFDEAFGVEGTGMAIIVDLVGVAVILLVGMLMNKKRENA